MCNVLRRARDGLGGVLLVDGEPGIGKTVLLSEAATKAAGHGFSLATGAADPLGQLVPFAPLLSAVPERLDEPPPQDADADLLHNPALLIGTLQSRLEQRAASAPVLVSLDDLQWADPLTLIALRMLPRELAPYPVAWILARSADQQGKRAGLLFDALEDDGAARITLAPLSQDAVAGVLAEAFGAPADQDLATLAHGAGGNPFLLTELIEGLREDNAVEIAEGHARLLSARLPQRIQLALRHRLDGLSRRTRHLLETAAVLGQSFRLDDAAEMMGETPASLLPAVEEALDSGILAAPPDALSFRHELAWRALTEMIPVAARKALHRQFGLILLERQDSPARAAGHLLEGALPGDSAALAGLDRAAAEVLGQSPPVAAALALRALELTPRRDPDRPTRCVTAAEALVAAGRLDDARDIASAAIAHPLARVVEARLRCMLASLHSMRGEVGQASAEAETVLAQPTLPPHVRDGARVAQLQALAGLRDSENAARVAREVLAAPGEYGQHVVAGARVLLAANRWDGGRLGDGLELLREAARGGGPSPDARHFQPLLALAAALVDLRQFGEAATTIRAADTEAIRGIPSQVIPAVLRARMDLTMGRLDDAVAEGEAALGVASALGAHPYTALAHCVLGVIALRRGDLNTAVHHMNRCPPEMSRSAAAYARTETAVMAAQVIEKRDGPFAAVSLIRQICDELPTHRSVLIGDPAAPAWLVRAALAAGEQGHAERVTRVADALAQDNPQFRAVTAAAAHCAGIFTRDPARLAHAAAEHPDMWARASATEDLGTGLVTLGDVDQAIQRLGEALDGYMLTGATNDVARVRRRLRRLGVRRRHWTTAGRPTQGWDSLTETERATAELVAQGLNNQQVADRLYVSVHTVAFHLRRVFRKLQIGSRVELARIVIQEQKPKPGPELASWSRRAQWARQLPHSHSGTTAISGWVVAANGRCRAGQKRMATRPGTWEEAELSALGLSLTAAASCRIPHSHNVQAVRCRRTIRVARPRGTSHSAAGPGQIRGAGRNH